MLSDPPALVPATATSISIAPQPTPGPKLESTSRAAITTPTSTVSTTWMVVSRLLGHGERLQMLSRTTTWGMPTVMIRVRRGRIMQAPLSLRWPVARLSRPLRREAWFTRFRKAVAF